MRHRRLALVTLLLIAVAYAGPVLLAAAFQDPVVQSGATAVAPPAVPVAEGTVVAPGQTNEWGVSLVMAYLVTVGMQLWKKSGVAGLSEDHSRIAKRVVAWLVAAASAAGIHASFDASSGVLTITGLLWTSIFESVGEIVRQYVAQQVMYHGVVQKMDTPA